MICKRMRANLWAILIVSVVVGTCYAGDSGITSTTEINDNDEAPMVWESTMNENTDQLASTTQPEHSQTDNEDPLRPTNMSTPRPGVSDDKVVGGQYTVISHHPYQLQMRSGIYGCGATIISDYWVVTAAHCLFSQTGVKVPLTEVSFRAGSSYRGSGGSVHTAVRSVIPRQYRPLASSEHDIALVKVRNPFRFSNLVQPIKLPQQGEEVPAGSPAIVTGWGATREGGSSSSILQRVTVPVVAQSTCRQQHRRSQNITPRMICAGSTGRDSCQGDSGGPMVVGGKLVGVTSSGIGCGRPSSPGVYTRVAAYRSYIKDITGI